MSESGKDTLELIMKVMKTLESLETSVSSLGANDKHLMDKLMEHGKAIASLSDKMLGTAEDHKRAAENLEMPSGRANFAQPGSVLHEPTHEMLQERLETIENHALSVVYDKVRQHEKVSETDIETIESALKRDPSDEQLLGLKAEALDAAGKKSESLKFIQESIAKNPKSAYLLYTNGVLLDSSESGEVLSLFSKALSLAREDEQIVRHQIYFSQAGLLLGTDRFDEALVSAEKALVLQPGCPDAWAVKGETLIQLNRILDALVALEKSLELNPSLARAWLGRGVALAILGKDHYDEAMECFEKSIQLRPDVAASYFNKGKLLWMKNQPSKALVFYDQGLQHDPKEPCALCQRGLILQELDRPKEALESFDDAVKIGLPHNCVVANLEMIEELLKLKRTKEAREVANAIDTTKIEDPKTLNGLAWRLYELGEFEKGAGIARKAIEKNPDDAHPWDTLACNLESMKSDPEAFEAFQKAKSLAKSDKMVTWKVYLRLCERMGKSEEAAEAKRKAGLGSN